MDIEKKIFFIQQGSVIFSSKIEFPKINERNHVRLTKRLRFIIGVVDTKLPIPVSINRSLNHSQRNFAFLRCVVLTLSILLGHIGNT